jgi:hypothetical protein
MMTQTFSESDGGAIERTPSLATSTPAVEAARKLRAVILLGGGVRSTDLTRAVGRSVLDLPLDKNITVIEHWVAEIGALASALAKPSLVVRLLLDETAPSPTSANSTPRVGLGIERDPDSLRGTGGLLADVTRDYGDDDLILAANAAQLLLSPLEKLFLGLVDRGADAALVAHRKGTPAGLVLLRCRCLRQIPEIGFVDLKEQALPAIAQRHDVAVLECDRPSGMPVRTRTGYLAALAACHRTSGRADEDSALQEDHVARFRIVEDGASVDPTARIHDAVILKGATVGPRAVVARSVVCPGATVRRGRMELDRVVSGR